MVSAPEPKRKVFRVSELTRLLKDLLEEEFSFLWVEGEVSNLKISSSGHLYFTLKDETSSIKCVIFRTYRQNLKFGLKDGLHVLCFGRLSLYEARGECQFLVQVVEPLGFGALQLAINQLRERLARRGFFDPDRKRPLPFWPRLVGVVTSLQGAALRDFLRVAFSRHPRAQVLIYPVKVQGDSAVSEIVQGIYHLSRHPGVEVLVVTRGGGSFEDLLPFNSEEVARAVFSSPVPVVSAVGHEIDWTICDLVADKRAPTPTAAAQLVFPDLSELITRYLSLKGRLKEALIRKISGLKRDLLRIETRLRDPRKQIFEAKRRHQELEERLLQATKALLRRKREALATRTKHLEALSPLAVLSRGYSLTRRYPSGEILRKASQVLPGERIEVLLSSGRLLARVEEAK